MIKCSWKSLTGIDCLTCGFQRSIEKLMEGDIVECFTSYPATIPLLFTLLFLGVHLAFKFKHGARTIIWLFSISVVFIVANFGVKLATGSAFH